MTESSRDPSIAELLSALARDTGALVKQEVRLASREMSVKAKRVGQSIALIAVGGALAVVGLVALAIAAITALHAYMPLWSAALLVAFVVLAAGFAFVTKWLSNIRHIDPTPQQALESLSADVSFAKEQVR